MKMFSLKKCLLTILVLASTHTPTQGTDCYAHTIFVPRQMAYNPLYEDALIFDEYAHMDGQLLLSVKPIYTQTVGRSLKKYFNINHECSMSVQENGSGNIDSLWFQVISAPGSYYSSALSFSPVQKTYGALLYFAWALCEDIALTINTAFVQRKNNMRICETNISGDELGQVPGNATISQAFMNPTMYYGRICGTQSKGGVDDLQIKLLKNFKPCDESLFWDIYALLGIPTGRGSRAQYLFEPLVGSNHVQFGLGLNAEKSFEFDMCNRFSLYGELKWRYGFKATETRSFDMTPNGQWSRYMLFTTPTASAIPFPAINNLTCTADVTPRNSLDVLLAAHVEQSSFSFELGYNFWYRQAERLCPRMQLAAVGIADLVGIAQLNSSTPVTVTTSSMATISEGVYPNQYQMPRDAAYTLVTPENINARSGTQAASFINAIFGSIGYSFDCVDLGINASYEGAARNSTASVVSVWANIDVHF